MSIDPVLLVGGSGVVGRWTARHLRDAHPDAPLLIGGRDLAKADRIAATVGNAEGVAIDLAADDLGLGRRAVSAVAVLLPDETRAGLRYANARGVPHISIASGVEDMGPDVATYVHNPRTAAIVLGTEWLVGATTIPTLDAARAFGRLREIRLGAVFDEEDLGGAAHLTDLKGLTDVIAPALTRRNGAYVWRQGEDARATVHALDGTPMDAFGLSINDVVALAAATDAPNVEFNLALGVSSSRRRGQAMSTEIIIELAGDDHEGKPLRTRRAVVHPEGQFPMTALGVAMVLERLVGLDGKPAAEPGLYFPYQLLVPATYFRRLEAIGGKVVDLAVP